jgi:hypothetical protein
MKKFVLLFVGRPGAPDAQDAQSQDYRRGWMAWLRDLGARGVVDCGLPMEWGGKEVRKDSVTDYRAADIDVGGFLVVKADSLDEAVEIAREAPHVAIGGTTIVRPAMDVGM